MEKLISTSYTQRARRIITGAAAVRFGRGRTELHFEHGQWWAFVRPRKNVDDDNRIFSVVDAVPGVDHRGIDFEET